jgi:PKHD-type hydroxylase
MMSTWPSFDYVKVLRGAFSIAECGDFIRLARQAGLGSGELGVARQCEIAWLPAPTTELVDRLAALGLAEDQFEMRQSSSGEAAQISQYRVGGRYDWHMDLGAGPMSLRKVSVVLELQSAFSGGGLEVFTIGDLSLQPGDVAVFPSFIMHRALPVASGERWSAAMWLSGDEPLR